MSLSPCSLVLWSGPASHSWLFQQCRVIVHHGGCGTLVSSLLAGKPQVECNVFINNIINIYSCTIYVTIKVICCEYEAISCYQNSKIYVSYLADMSYII